MVDSFIQCKQYDFTLYNCQKAKDVWRNKQNSEVSRIRVEVRWNCNLNQIGGYKSVNNNKSQVCKLWSSQLWTQFKQLHIEAWKSQDFNGV